MGGFPASHFLIPEGIGRYFKCKCVMIRSMDIIDSVFHVSHQDGKCIYIYTYIYIYRERNMVMILEFEFHTSPIELMKRTMT